MTKDYLKDPDFQPLIIDYLNLVQKYIEEAETSLNSEDFDNISKIGHNLKGTGSSYGFNKITELGKQLNETSKLTEIKKIRDLLDQIKTAVKSFQKLF